MCARLLSGDRGGDANHVIHMVIGIHGLDTYEDTSDAQMCDLLVVDWFPVTVAIPDLVGTVEGIGTVCAAIRAGLVLQIVLRCR